MPVNTKAISYIMHPLVWTKFPWCPLRKDPPQPKHGLDFQIGALYAGDYTQDRKCQLPLKVYGINIFAAPKTEEELREKKIAEYPTIEALLADGWFVD